MIARWRWLKRAGIAAGVGVGLIGMGVSGFLIWLRTDSGNRWLTEKVEGIVNGRLTEGSFELGALRTDLTSGIELSEVSLQGADGKPRISGNLQVEVDILGGLLSLGKRWRASKVTLEKGNFSMAIGADGVSDIGRLFGQTEPSPPSDEPWGGLPVAFVVDKLTVRDFDVAIALPSRTWALDSIEIDARVGGRDRIILAQQIDLKSDVVQPDWKQLTVFGAVRYTGDGIDLNQVRLALGDARIGAHGSMSGFDDSMSWDLRAHIGHLPLDMLNVLMSKPLFRGDVAGNLRLKGPEDSVKILGALRASKGALNIGGTVNMADDDIPWRATIGVSSFDVDGLIDTKDTPVVLNGIIAAEGKGTEWPDNMVIVARYDGQVPNVRDIRFDRLRADLRIEKGLLTISQADIGGPLGDFRADGSLDLVGGDIDVTAAGQVFLTGLRQFQVDMLGGTGNVHAQLTGNVFNLKLGAKGTVAASQLTYEDQVKLESAQIAFQWQLIEQVQAVTADIIAENSLIYGIKLNHLAVPALRVDLPVGGAVQIAGPILGEGIYLPGELILESATGGFQVGVPSDKLNTSVMAKLDLGAAQWPSGFTTSDGKAEFGMLGDDFHLQLLMHNKSKTFLNVVGNGSTDPGQLQIETLLLSPTPRQQWALERPGQIRWSPDGRFGIDVAISSDLGRLQVNGELAETGPIQGSVDIQKFQLDTIAELFPEKAGGLSGVIDLDLDYGGTGEALTASATATGQGLWLPGISRWLDLSLAVELAGEELGLDVDVASAQRPLLAVTGKIPVIPKLYEPKLKLAGPVDLSAELIPGSFARLEQLIEADIGLPTGDISASVQLSGQLGDPDLELLAVTEIEVPSWVEPGRVEARVFRQGSDVALHMDLRQGFAERGRIDGTAKTRIGEVLAWIANEGPEPNRGEWSLYADDLQIKLAALGTPIESLFAISNTPVEATGDLLGGIVISGSPRRPVLSGGFNWVNAQLGSVAIPGAYLAVVPNETGYKIDGTFSFEETGELVVSGAIPLDVDLINPWKEWSTGDIDVSIGGNGIPLGLLRAFIPASDASGLLKVDGKVTGPLLSPSPEVTAAIDNGAMTIEPAGIRLTNIQADVSLVPERFQIREFSFDSGVAGRRTRNVLERVSHVSLKGTSRLDAWSPTGTRFTLEMDRALLASRPDLRLRMSGPITVQGDWPELKVEGKVKVNDAYFSYDAERMTDVSGVLDPVITVHRGAVEVPAPEPSGPPVWAPIAVNVHVDLNHAAEVDAKLPVVDQYGQLFAAASTASVRARLHSPDVGVQMANGNVKVESTVEITDGQVSLLQNQFDIRGGSVTFLGDPTNPLLNIDATTKLDAGEVTLGLRGSALAPKAELYSDTYDQTEIFTALVTGSAPDSINAAGVGASTASAVGGLFLGGLTSQFRARMMTVDPDGSVLLRLPIARTFQAYVRVSPLKERDGNRGTVGIEGSLFGNTTLEAAFGDKRSWTDLYWEVRF